MLTSGAFWTAIAGVLGSISAIIGVLVHRSGPKHNRGAAPVRPPRP